MRLFTNGNENQCVEYHLIHTPTLRQWFKQATSDECNSLKRAAQNMSFESL